MRIESLPGRSNRDDDGKRNLLCLANGLRQGFDCAKGKHRDTGEERMNEIDIVFQNGAW